MSTLTDEEKARINELLADMDENGTDLQIVIFFQLISYLNYRGGY